MKILELTNFSSGICGVWQRVKQESELLSKNHEVLIFSSNAVKGSDKFATREDKIGSVTIKRFPFKKLGGESFMKWDFEKEALEYKPDIIIAHNYRHPHTTKALSIAKKINCKVVLVTHAPFIEKNITRSFLENIVVKFYDRFIGAKTINKFNKVIAITKWEIPYLLKLGCEKKRIEYIPNGIPDEFFKKNTKKGDGILFLGRVSPIKNLETLILVAKNLKKKITIVGSVESKYKKILKGLMTKKRIKNIDFVEPVYDLKEKIDLIDKYGIFVLPSKREAMPQVLIEAMSRGKIVISSKTQGGKEIVEDEKNGFLFNIGNKKDLESKIKKIDTMSEKEKNRIRKNAIKAVEKFEWSKLIKKLEKVIHENTHN